MKRSNEEIFDKEDNESKKQKTKFDLNKSIIHESNFNSNGFSFSLMNEQKIIDECLKTVKSGNISTCNDLKINLESEAESFKLLKEKKQKEIEDCEKMIEILNKYKNVMKKSVDKHTKDEIVKKQKEIEELLGTQINE